MEPQPLNEIQLPYNITPNKTVQSKSVDKCYSEKIQQKFQVLNVECMQIEDQKNFIKKQNNQMIPNSGDHLDRKKIPEFSTTKNKNNDMDIQNNTKLSLNFQELPQDVELFLSQIYYIKATQKLYLSGIMSNGQTLSIIANENYRDLYFCLRAQYDELENKQQYQQKAKKQIDTLLRQMQIQVKFSRFEQKSYVFQINDMPRQKRQYYRVRYAFKNDPKEPIQPDFEGKYFKYVFGTTYNPMQLFIINSQIKGPCWIQIQKKDLSLNTKVSDVCLCADIVSVEAVQTIQKKALPKMRVLSLSIKSVVPKSIKHKKLFPIGRPDQSHVFAISYHFCEKYDIQSKPSKLILTTKTFFLKQFGKPPTKDYISCNDERDMFTRFLADLKSLDPDFLVCHDASTVLDSLLLRMVALDKNFKPRFGRFAYNGDISKSNQIQRINNCIAGRMIVDTYIHSKDMVKSVDYSLQAMSKMIKPEKKFKGINNDELIQLINANRTIAAINTAVQQSQCTFALMNHLQVIQITKSLSNICGNTWKRSLQNQRAERNQYLIMHQCFERDLIIPDKYMIAKGQEADEGDKKKYEGGLVLNPETGMYNDFILLLDFNSLYPSLIREYNICFSKIQRPLLPFTYYHKPQMKKKTKQQKQKQKQKIEQGGNIKMEIEGEQQMKVIPPVPAECDRKKWGFLPYLIDKIVQQRKKCKRQMKKEKAPEKIIILDIQQKSYKIVANSIYGCLGFKFSRFYSKHLAALVTRMGRQALMRGRDIVNSDGKYHVIYGDTDSLMIQPRNFQKETDRQKIIQLKGMSKQLKDKINKEYKNLEIDIDGIYKPLILLQKKKYVANKLKNYEDIIFDMTGKVQPAFDIQYKGIEVVRRDGCSISRTVLKEIIDILIHSKKNDIEEIQQIVVQYFTELNQRLSKKVPYKQFLLANFLSKKTKQYSQGQHLPHVKVALNRIANGQKQQSLVGHMIYYLICQPRNETQDNYAKRAWDDLTYEKSQKNDKQGEKLRIDYNYYKTQIIRPVARILTTVKMSLDRISLAFGLDKLSRQKIKKYVENQQMEDNPINQTNILEVILNKDFSKKAEQLELQLGVFKCSCGQQCSLLIEQNFRMSCPRCEKAFHCNLYNKIKLMIKKKTSQYYNNDFRCKCNWKNQYILTPITSCCKIKQKDGRLIPYILHDMLYLCKDICDGTLRNSKNIDDEKKMRPILQSIDQFLSQSQYQDVGKLFNLLK